MEKVLLEKHTARYTNVNSLTAVFSFAINYTREHRMCMMKQQNNKIIGMEFGLPSLSWLLELAVMQAAESNSNHFLSCSNETRRKLLYWRLKETRIQIF